MVEDSIGTSKMGGDRVNGLGIDLLNQSNYLVRRTCMESYLIGEDLWEIINRYSRNALANTPENNNALKKCKQLNAKAKGPSLMAGSITLWASNLPMKFGRLSIDYLIRRMKPDGIF